MQQRRRIRKQYNLKFKFCFGIRPFYIVVFDKYSVRLKPEAKLAITLDMTKKPSNSSWPAEN